MKNGKACTLRLLADKKPFDPAHIEGWDWDLFAKPQEVIEQLPTKFTIQILETSQYFKNRIDEYLKDTDYCHEE